MRQRTGSESFGAAPKAAAASRTGAIFDPPQAAAHAAAGGGGKIAYAVTMRPEPVFPLHMPSNRVAGAAAAGERWIAGFEAAKGLLVILAGFGLLSLMHHDLQHFAHAFVDHLHLSPDGRVSHVFLTLSAAAGQQLWLLAALSCAYATLRFAEAYGLWHGRRWAKWFAVASGGLYLPLEAYELLHGINWIKAAAFLLNAGIVLYMIHALRRSTVSLAKGKP